MCNPWSDGIRRAESRGPSKDHVPFWSAPVRPCPDRAPVPSTLVRCGCCDCPIDPIPLHNAHAHWPDAGADPLRGVSTASFSDIWTDGGDHRGGRPGLRHSRRPEVVAVETTSATADSKTTWSRDRDPGARQFVPAPRRQRRTTSAERRRPRARRVGTHAPGGQLAYRRDPCRHPAQTTEVRSDPRVPATEAGAPRQSGPTAHPA